MNWKIRFHEIAHENILEALRKHPGLDSFHGNNFTHKFLDNPKIPERLNNLLCLLSPIYRRKEGGGCCPARPGKLGFFHQKAPFWWNPWKAQVGLIAICTPILLNTLLLYFFCWFISETLRNFTDYVMTPIFFSECYETLRIMQQRPFWLPECCGTLRIAQQCPFWLSKCCRTLRIT